MEDEKLIELVREHNVLFDLSHPKYMDPKYKMKIWKEIGEHLNANEIQCKNRWINIRDQFRRHVAKRESRSGQAAVTCKNYKYEDQMQFLLPHLKERRTMSNITSVTEANELENDSEIIVVEQEPEIHSEVASNTQSNLYQTSRVNRKRKNNDDESPASQMMKYILDKNKISQNTQRHPVDSFVLAIADTIKTFTPYHQHLAKSRIFSVVQELEWEQLQNSSSQPHTSSSSQTYSPEENL